MNEATLSVQELLREHGYVVEPASDGAADELIFEGENTIGFVVVYADLSRMFSGWRTDCARLFENHQLGLRRSLDKAWNSYSILLTSEKATRLQQSLLDSIEEDLVGTRKVARSGITTKEEAARALLPLMPIQSFPNLEPVDMEEEIRIRSTQIPSQAVDTFFLSQSLSSTMQLLEEL